MAQFLYNPRLVDAVLDWPGAVAQQAHFGAQPATLFDAHPGASAAAE
ncbi:hypothetical protein [Rhizorhabdus sp.]|nr:hypothetical protein [Rhizorhabdus sp.]MBP8232287.1 hypothetical protein [Rhizorhabdus sp.]